MEILNKIFNEKWIISILITLMIGFMVIKGTLTQEVFVPLATLMLGYWFGSSKDNNTKEGQ